MSKNVPNLFISVIVPVFNDGKRLKICLEALENQTYPKNLYEIIVVDNASDVTEDIKNIIIKFEQVFLTFEKIPGSYAARNRGISIAKGEIICFTDSDCIPASDWIEKGVKNLLSQPNCGLVAGKIEIFFKDRSRITAIELFDSIMSFNQKQFLEEGKFGATANIFTWKSTLAQVGVFDASLKSSGDVEWGRRVAAFGYSQIYAEDTSVAHPARHSLKQVYKKFCRLAGGAYNLHCRKEASWLKRNQACAALLWDRFVFPLRILGKFILIKPCYLEYKFEKFDQGLKFILLMFFAKYTEVLEIVRIHIFGKITARE